jgi:hypothetical protein
MRVLHRLRGKVPIWPFDPIPRAGPLLVEIYTAVAALHAGRRKGASKIRDRQSLDEALGVLKSEAHKPLDRYDDHSTDAILTTAWLRNSSLDARLWAPDRMSDQVARTEGWTFGVL